MNNFRIYSRAALVLATLTSLLLSGCASGPPSYGEVAGPEKSVSGSVGNVQEIILELPTGDVEVVAVPGTYVSAKLEMRCDVKSSSCVRLAEKVVLKKQVFENRMYIAPSTQSKFAFRNAQSDYRIQVPDNLPLRIVMGYGDLNVKGIRSNLTIDMKAGEINVEAPLSEVRKVWADANFGDAKVVGTESDSEGERRFIVGAEASWDQGPGQHDIAVNLGAGDITVALTGR